jgi:glyoxylase-like metal-dependent hydrolase (beta-lactamase superfamily II)
LEAVSPLVRRLVAPNPGPFTLHGTNTYVVGAGRVAVIDPGPLLAEHLAALEGALGGETVTHVLVTHTHRDHSPAAPALAARHGAATAGYGPHGRADPLHSGAEEAVDEEFHPDLPLDHGDRVEGPRWTLEAVHTPGHTSNHLCYALPQERSLFTGDHVMAWATSVVIPPDGDMRAYVASLRLLAERADAVLWPGHGPPVTAPGPYLEALIAHRAERERAILDLLAGGPSRIAALVPVIYAEVDQVLHRAAGLSVLAHLRALVAEGRVHCDGPPGLQSTYRIAPTAGA